MNGQNNFQGNNGFNPQGNNGFNPQQSGYDQGQNNGYQQQQQNGYQQQNNGFQQQQNGGYGNSQNPGYGEPSGGMFVDSGAAADAGMGDLDAGKYLVVISNAEYKANNSGTGMRLNCEFTVIDGLYSNRKLFDGYNLQHNNAQTQAISQSQYAKLCESAFGKGAARPTNPQALIGAKLVIDWGFKRKKKDTNNQYQEEPEAPRAEVLDRLPASAYHGSQPQQQQIQQSQQNHVQQQAHVPQNNGYQQQQQNNYQPQQQQQNNVQQYNGGQQQQQNGFQPNAGNQPANNQPQGGFQQQQSPNGGQPEGVQLQQQNQQGQADGGAGALQQGQAQANGNTGAVNGSPFGAGFNNI